jgi:hypothetical protein
MSAQIAFTLPDKRKKQLLQKQLQADGLTAKSFFTFCIDGYLHKKIRIGVLSDYDDEFSSLSVEEATHLEEMNNIESMMQHL